jgi:tetratricopeptide (TPR) repeat protein
MVRSRVVLIFIILASVASLYSLPRVVVENEENNLGVGSSANESAAPDAFEHAEIPHHPGMHVPDSVVAVANKLRMLLFSASNQEKRLIFADSLATLYRNAGAYDSAWMYFDVKVETAASLENLIQAGDASYEAMGFAMDQVRRVRWAERAQGYYNRALEMQADLPDVQVKLGMTHLSGNNPMVGITMIRQVAEKYPENALALYQLGMLSVSTGQYDKAIERFKALLEIDPDNAEGVFYLGYSYFESDRFDEARTRFEQVLKLEVSSELQETARQYLKQINNT